MEAESLFRDFARRHSFTIERIDNAPIELMMRLSKQPGLSFELTLALQNGDELNIGFEKFWSYFFPYEKKRRIVLDALDAIASGDCRLAIHTQRGGVVRRVLEKLSDGLWQPIYVAHSGVKFPFLTTSITYLRNEDVRPEKQSV